MSKAHTRYTVIMVDGDVVPYCNASDITDKADKHDTTVYGDAAHDYDGGIGDGEISIGGWYDTTALTGPTQVLRPLKGTKVTFERRLEGTGTGKPAETCTVLVEEVMVSAPVADYAKWTCKLQPTTVVTYGTQA